MTTFPGPFTFLVPCCFWHPRSPDLAPPAQAHGQICKVHHSLCLSGALRTLQLTLFFNRICAASSLFKCMLYLLLRRDDPAPDLAMHSIVSPAHLRVDVVCFLLSSFSSVPTRQCDDVFNGYLCSCFSSQHWHDLGSGAWRTNTLLCPILLFAAQDFSRLVTF